MSWIVAQSWTKLSGWSAAREVLVAGDRHDVFLEEDRLGLEAGGVDVGHVVGHDIHLMLQRDLPRQADELRIFHRAWSPLFAEPSTSPGRRSDWQLSLRKPCQSRKIEINQRNDGRGAWLPIRHQPRASRQLRPGKICRADAVFQPIVNHAALSSIQRPDSSAARGFGAWRRKPKSKTATAAEAARRRAADQQEAADHHRRCRGRRPRRRCRRLSLPVLGAAAGGRACRGCRDDAEPSFIFNLPTMTVNLQNEGDGEQFMKLTIALEVADEHVMTEIQPRMAKVVDAFQVYLRELRKSDLEGSAGIYRLKEELRRRVNVAIYPARSRKHPVQGNPGAVMAGEQDKLADDWVDASDPKGRAAGHEAADDRRPGPQPGRDRQPARLRSHCAVSETLGRPGARSTRRSSATSACRCSRSSSTGWCGCRRPRCAISPPTTSRSRSSRSPRCASATTSIRSRCRPSSR